MENEKQTGLIDDIDDALVWDHRLVIEEGVLSVSAVVFS